MRMQSMLYILHERYRRISLLQRDPDRDLHAEHQRILDACLQRDGDEAARLVQEHITRTVDAVMAVFAARNTGKAVSRRVRHPARP